MFWFLLNLAQNLLVVYIIVQIVRFVFADADLNLLFWEKFGSTPEVLAGKVVWITGASDGIGEHLAYALACAGCKLVLTARREAELERVKKSCILSSNITKEDDILVLPLDMCHMDKHEAATQQVIDKFGQIDILVNNAGRSQRAFIIDVETQVDRDMMELNVHSVFSLTRAVLRHMVKRKKGHVVATSSVAGKLGAPFSSSYVASKYALQGWFETLRMEHANDNIDVTLVCPGPVYTNITREAMTGKSGESYGKPMETTENRVTAERCADLMAVALANRVGECWIALNPILFFVYTFQYCPDLGRVLGKRLGIKTIMKLRKP